MAKSLTLGEIDFIETFTGQSFSGMNEHTPTGKFMIAMVTVVKKREDKDFTVEDAYSIPADEAAEIIKDFQPKQDDAAGE